VGGYTRRPRPTHPHLQSNEGINHSPSCKSTCLGMRVRARVRSDTDSQLHANAAKHTLSLHTLIDHGSMQHVQLITRLRRAGGLCGGVWCHCRISSINWQYLSASFPPTHPSTMDRAAFQRCALSSKQSLVTALSQGPQLQRRRSSHAGNTSCNSCTQHDCVRRMAVHSHSDWCAPQNYVERKSVTPCQREKQREGEREPSE
jgi:hypothetical protein